MIVSYLELGPESWFRAGWQVLSDFMKAGTVGGMAMVYYAESGGAQIGYRNVQNEPNERCYVD